MCGRSYAGRKVRFGPRQHGGGHGDFFGLDAEKMSPRARVVVALSVLAPVALSGFALVAFVPGLWWIFTTYFWIAFPAFGLLARGIAGLSDAEPVRITAEAREKELLGALKEHGELSSARAAMETSLSVTEADGMLNKLAQNGHLEVRVRGGGLHYALWDAHIAPGGRNREAEIRAVRGGKRGAA